MRETRVSLPARSPVGLSCVGFRCARDMGIIGYEKTANCIIKTLNLTNAAKFSYRLNWRWNELSASRCDKWNVDFARIQRSFGLTLRWIKMCWNWHYFPEHFFFCRSSLFFDRRCETTASNASIFSPNSGLALIERSDTTSLVWMRRHFGCALVTNTQPSSIAHYRLGPTKQ